MLLKKMSGLDYTGRIENDDKRLRGYEGCYPVKRILTKMKISSKDAVLDIGCGKGLFLYYATKFGFGKIDGIEYSSELTDVANNNAKIIDDKRMGVYNIDARSFADYDKYNYFFINNPFGSDVMEEIAGKIRDSAIVTGRSIYVIYQFPFNIETFIKNGFELKIDRNPNTVLIFNPWYAIFLVTDVLINSLTIKEGW